MRRVLVTVALALVTSAGAASVASAATSAGLPAGNDLCDELIVATFTERDTRAEAEEALEHYEAAAEDAPKSLKRAFKRVIGLLQDVVDGDRTLEDLRDPPGKVFRALTKLVKYADEHC